MARTTPTHTKKDQILTLYRSGASSIGEIAALSHAHPSYVAQVLRDEKILRGYFDLYTSTKHPMNIYSPLFANRLGFRTEGIARRSVAYIDRLYQQFLRLGDRAGQHHALVVALTMMNRAFWSKKPQQAELFRSWIMKQLADIDAEHAALPSPQRRLRHNS